PSQAVSPVRVVEEAAHLVDEPGEEQALVAREPQLDPSALASLEHLSPAAWAPRARARGGARRRARPSRACGSKRRLCLRCAPAASAWSPWPSSSRTASEGRASRRT